MVVGLLRDIYRHEPLGILPPTTSDSPTVMGNSLTIRDRLKRGHSQPPLEKWSISPS